MATIAENLTLLKSTKAGIKAAIEAKGVSNVGDKFSDYPAKIASIPTGFLGLFPYLATLIALILSSKKSRAPLASGQPF